ncbi:MAG: hypothetical protein A2729_03645 [Candidatus Buchananbacteria bacterium RIFCSPHIGHO2_01_FULL_39_14]|uniref:Thioredoxin domain-containing protein n=1 Tax=Candidatus Buchananbacteria bacterium RIFCSPHIGHO2_01_FULL_39_14 TaxID=1797532 RepID=A0A1G1XWF5_9BACT|nr:MAG: hypothetical protein A2729_03645 [Candidatus Buchananbacteria bacterium RIFCSPHIGHO2_01_FULL_39_14]
MRKYIIILLSVLLISILLLSGCTPQINSEKIQNQKESKPIKSDIPTNANTNQKYTGELLAGTQSPYLIFNTADYEKAIREHKIILLYFYANWCPLCKQEQPEIIAAFNQLQNENIIGFRVNYKDSETDDSEVAIATQFGIAYQHTKVILKENKIIIKAPNSWNKEKYVEEIAKSTT